MIYAKVVNNIVKDVIDADEAHINKLSDKDFYILDDGTKKNSAGLEFTFDASRNAFIAPRPFPSWTLNETTCQWEAPVAQTVSYEDKWNEETQSWFGEEA